MSKTSERRPWMSDADLEAISWSEAYRECWADLVCDRYDYDLVMEEARTLYATKGHLSPWRVAKADFDAMDDKADYLPGGQHWSLVNEKIGFLT